MLFLPATSRSPSRRPPSVAAAEEEAGYSLVEHPSEYAGGLLMPAEGARGR